MEEFAGRSRLLAAAHGKPVDRPPVWMMRQAGRYLPEYREIREEYSFREAISTPEIAMEISLQPWERFRPDGVVMYSDILTALEPLGIDYSIESGVGPVIEQPIETVDDLDPIPEDLDAHLGYVGRLLSGLDEFLDDAAGVIGFIGGPLTLLAYAVEGRPSKSFIGIRRLLYTDPHEFQRLLQTLGSLLTRYVDYQIDNGADVIQLFDTYAGLLPEEVYREYLLPVQREILADVDVPTIVYARNMGGRLDLLADSGADVVGIDWTMGIADARERLGDTPVQGNLDPAALYGTPTEVKKRTQALISAAGGAGHILNLGHGLDKDTPPENVAAFFDAARSYSA